MHTEIYTDKLGTTFLKNLKKKINKLRLWAVLNHTIPLDLISFSTGFISIIYLQEFVYSEDYFVSENSKNSEDIDKENLYQ
jgi:hypothetical protein